MQSFRYTITTIVSLILILLVNRVSAFLAGNFNNHQKESLSSSSSFMTSAATASPQSESSSLSSSSPRIVRVLALHGSEGTGSDFVERILPLVEVLESQQNVQVDVTAITAPFDKGNGKAWWIMNPGERSFTTSEFQGFETSVLLVLDAIEKKGPFDVILGHSQGAILISALLALKRLEHHHPSIGYILNGVAMPNPYKKELESLRLDGGPRVLFVLGENDKMNPIEVGNTVKDCMEQAGLDVSVCYHPGGHSVPVKDKDAVQIMSTWIVDGII